jgi:gamma-glutamyltranspeptidase/glutathione hydrolase
MAVAMTSSIEDGFGSRLMVNGYLLNNQLTDFSFTSVDAAGLPVANRWSPASAPAPPCLPCWCLTRQAASWR